MKKIVFYLSLFLVVTLLFSSCFNDDEYYVKTTEYIPIIAYHIPDSASVSDTLEITAVTEVSSTCWHGLEFVLHRLEDTSYSFFAYGIFESYGYDCKPATIRRDTTILFQPDTTGTLIFYVRRDIYTLEKDTMYVD